MSRCPQCGQLVEAAAEFCGHCGARQPKVPTCPKCGNQVEASTRFCGSCGESLQEPITISAAPPPVHSTFTSHPISTPTGYMPGSFTTAHTATMTPAAIANNSGMGAASVLPTELRGFNWGAFLMNWIWAIAHNTWIGLLALVPYVGVVMVFVLGFKGNEWAWQNRKWQNIEHFRKTQKVWAIWGVVLWIVTVIFTVIILLLAAMLSATQSGSTNVTSP